MVTMDVAPSDSGEEEGREMKNPTAVLFLFFSCLLFFALPPLSERLEKVRIECLVSE